MNIPTTRYVKRGTALAGLLFATLVMAACASAPESPRGAADVRDRLTALQNDPNVADHARVELREAEAAVVIAEQSLPDADMELGEHRVYMADQAVSIAEAMAATRYAEVQRVRLGEEREALRLQARTREADRARGDASRARSDASRARDAASRARDAATRARTETEQARRDAIQARDEAVRARGEADAAQSSAAEMTAAAAREAADYQRRIDELQAEVTDRGLVLTLGDVLFETGSAELQGGVNTNLDNLVGFLNQYPERRVQIEGHTDNVGDVQYNQGLSRQRADSVGAYLMLQGITSQRLSTSGIGMDRPVATNGTATGRQQNRRVEIIIENPS
ncbi:MAG: OmpA family protein [Pseudomonadota bacterium]